MDIRSSQKNSRKNILTFSILVFQGLCQERAYVSGMQAANSLLDSTLLSTDGLKKAKVLPVREDEAQFKLGVEVNRKVMSVVPRFWTR